MAIVTPMKTAVETALDAAFGTLKDALPGSGSRREEAFARYSANGLPHRRVEEWKYFDLRAMLRQPAPLAGQPAPQAAAAALRTVTPLSENGARIDIANGHVVGMSADLPAGVTVTKLSDALSMSDPRLSQLGVVEISHGNAAIDLNTAFMTDGAIIEIAAGVKVDQAVQIAFANFGSDPFATAARVLVIVGEGASFTLLETHAGPDGVAYQPNTQVEFILGDHAELNHVRLNREGNQAIVLSNLLAKLGAEASFTTFNGVFGSQAARHQVFVKYAGADAKASINGSAMLSASQHADTTLVVDHAEPGGESRELFRFVLDDETTGVFQGKIIVRQKAQKTDGQMMSGALLLAEGASMNNKPELEIFADDVLCAHGATCGALDEDLLFYLKARGLPPAEAEALLIQAFVGLAMETVADEDVRTVLQGLAEDWLRRRGDA